MILSWRSEQLLRYEKTRAKLVEFAVPEDRYPRFAADPDDLIFSTVFALSRYCEELLAHPGAEEISMLKEDLITVSQYYNAVVQGKQHQDHDQLFLLIGATAYYLSDDFGSAKVLVSKIDSWKPHGKTIDFLFYILRYLLCNKKISIDIIPNELKDIAETVTRHFDEGADERDVYSALQRLMEHKPYQDSEEDTTFSDFVYAIVVYAMKFSARILLPQYTKCEEKYWDEYFIAENSLKLIWPAQKLIFDKGALQHQDMVVPLPTGVGKTKSIELIIRASFLQNKCNAAIIIAPLRALCNEITSELIDAFGKQVVINQFSDTMQEDFEVEMADDFKHIFICTPEKLSYVIRHEDSLLSKIGLYIFDEAHLFDDPNRGALYELLVSEINRNRDDNSQMILFSAVLSNASQLADWLFHAPDACINYALVRTTEKAIGFASSDGVIHYYEQRRMDEQSFFVPHTVKQIQLQRIGLERKDRVFPENNSRDLSLYYAFQLCSIDGVAIFAGQVRSIPGFMRRIVDLDKRSFDLKTCLKNDNAKEKEKLSKLLQIHYGKKSEVVEAATIGVYPHYAGLPSGVKAAIEYALRKRHIHLVICTSTLAEGVNLPIKHLIFSTLTQGRQRIQARKMQNLIGRTGRSGMYTEGSIIIAIPDLYDNQHNYSSGGHHKWFESKRLFMQSNIEASGSTILCLINNMKLDYQHSLPGENLTRFLIKNYGQKDCYLKLNKMIKEAYVNKLSIEEYDKNRDIMLTNVAIIESTINNIESYLCYLYEQHGSSFIITQVAEDLITSSFAYYLADEEQKKRLKELFQTIAQRIQETLGIDQHTYYSRSMYGIAVSKEILNWVNNNLLEIQGLSLEDLASTLINTFYDLFSDKVTLEKEVLYRILLEWIEGKMYYDGVSQEMG